MQYWVERELQLEEELTSLKEHYENELFDAKMDVETKEADISELLSELRELSRDVLADRESKAEGVRILMFD